MTKTVSAWVVMATFLVSTLAVPAGSAEAQASNPNLNRLVVDISGTVDGVPGTLEGTFTFTRFALQGGELVAVGVLAATVTDAAGNILRTIIRQIAIPVTAIDVQGECEILHLELGPLDLNLLGLMIHLDRIVLDITAQSGPGNLLGNLLCAIAGLLDANSLGQQLVTLLNQLLGALATL